MIKSICALGDRAGELVNKSVLLTWGWGASASKHAMLQAQEQTAKEEWWDAKKYGRKVRCGT